jgi:transposase
MDNENTSTTVAELEDTFIGPELPTDEVTELEIEQEPVSEDELLEMVGEAKPDEGPSKSAQIKALAATGMSVGDIARTVGVRYQHAYGVLKAAAVANGGTVPTAKREGPSKSERIRQLHAQGLTKGQIAKELGIRYQFVYGVLSRPLVSQS